MGELLYFTPLFARCCNPPKGTATRFAATWKASPTSPKKTNALPNAGGVHTAEQRGLRACIRLARSRYFALVFCGDTGLERGSMPDQGNPRLGPSGAPTSPESGLAVSNDVRKLSREN